MGTSYSAGGAGAVGRLGPSPIPANRDQSRGDNPCPNHDQSLSHLGQRLVIANSERIEPKPTATCPGAERERRTPRQSGTIPPFSFIPPPHRRPHAQPIFVPPGTKIGNRQLRADRTEAHSNVPVGRAGTPNTAAERHDSTIQLPFFPRAAAHTRNQSLSHLGQRLAKRLGGRALPISDIRPDNGNGGRGRRGNTLAGLDLLRRERGVWKEGDQSLLTSSPTGARGRATGAPAPGGCAPPTAGRAGISVSLRIALAAKFKVPLPSLHEIEGNCL